LNILIYTITLLETGFEPNGNRDNKGLLNTESIKILQPIFCRLLRTTIYLANLLLWPLWFL